MKNRILSIMMTAVLLGSIFCVGGCGSSGDASGSDESQASEVSASGETTDSGKTAKTSSANIKMSDTLTDYTFKLDGVVYQLPCDFSQFMDNGWEIAEDSEFQADSEMDPGDFYSITLAKGDNEVFANLENTTDAAFSVSEASVTSVEVDSDYVIDSDILELAQGLTMATSMDEAAKILGVEWTEDAEEGNILIFQDESSDYYGEIECGSSTGAEIDKLLIAKESAFDLD